MVFRFKVVIDLVNVGENSKRKGSVNFHYKISNKDYLGMDHFYDLDFVFDKMTTFHKLGRSKNLYEWWVQGYQFKVIILVIFSRMSSKLWVALLRLTCGKQICLIYQINCVRFEIKVWNSCTATNCRNIKPHSGIMSINTNKENYCHNHH